MNRHNDEDTKLMGWLMNGAGHGTVDVCGENLGFLNRCMIVLGDQGCC